MATELELLKSPALQEEDIEEEVEEEDDGIDEGSDDDDDDDDDEAGLEEGMHYEDAYGNSDDSEESYE